MNARQMHYTSCRRGMGGFAGFQVRARTEGIDKEDEAELVQLGGYDPPGDAPPEPTAEELRTGFPRAFRFARLPSGAQGIILSSYVGQDYSGRWGNFFAHSLVLQDLLGDRWPIDLFEWEGWRNGLSPEEDVDADPPPLDPVDLDAIPSAESFSFELLAEFLSGDGNRTSVLARMVRALFLREETSRPVVVRDTPLHGLFWIACVQKCFPPQLMDGFSFSTFQYNPMSCAAVNATSGETDFLFSERERAFQLYLFDQLDGPSSEVPDETGDYAEIVTRWMASDPQLLQEFQAFTALFALDGIGPDLVHVVNLYRAAIQDQPVVSANELSDALNYLEQRVTSRGHAGLIPRLYAAMSTASASGDRASMATLVRLLAAGARRTEDADHRALACRAWFLMYDQVVVDQGRERAVLGALRSKLVASLGQHRADLAREALKRSRVESYLARLDELPAQGLEAILAELVDAAQILGRVPVWEQKPLMPFIERLALELDGQPSGLQRVLGCLGEDPEAIAWTCRSMVRRLVRTRRGDATQQLVLRAGRALAQVLLGLDPATAQAVREALDTDETRELLYGEWLTLLQEAPDGRSLFVTYQRNILGRLPALQAARGDDIRLSLLRALDARSRGKQARQWLDSGDVDGFPGDLRGECIEAAAASLSLDPTDEAARGAAVKIRELLVELDASLTPDLPRVREIIDELSAPQEGERPPPLFDGGALTLKGISNALTDVSDVTYREFLQYGFHLVVRRFTDGEGYARILEVLAGQKRKIFLEFYTGYLSNGEGANLAPAQWAALYFWLDQRGPVGKANRRMQQPALDALAKRLTRMPRADWKRTRDKLERKLGEKPPPMTRKRWQSVRTRVDEVLDPTFRGRVGSLLWGKKKGR